MIPAVLAFFALQEQTRPASTALCERLVHVLDEAAAVPEDSLLRAARETRRRCKNDFAAVLSAGRALSHRSNQTTTKYDRQLRLEAEQLLGRATVLNPNSAIAWLEYGVFLRKRGGIPVDADRAIRKGLALAEAHPDQSSPELLAQFLFERARVLQFWVDRLRDLKDGSLIGVSTPACSSIGAFCENFTEPAHANARLRDAPSVDPGFWDQRTKLLNLYRRILALTPRSFEPERAYLRELALGEEWDALQAEATRSVAVSEQPATLVLFAALGWYKTKRVLEADSVFRHGIERLPDSIRMLYERPPKGLDTIPDFWNRARPLWVAPVNEIQLDYWARLTYATLVFTDPEGRGNGVDTPMGDALLRYGWPTMITQVERDARRVLDAAQESNANYFLTCTPADVSPDPARAASYCEPPAGSGFAQDQSGGRWIFWTYAMDRPSFIFEVRPGQRTAAYMRESAASLYADQLRRATAYTFSSPITKLTVPIPLQIARFRGDRAELSAIGVFGAIPVQELGAGNADSLLAGFFVFADAPGMPERVQQVRRVSAGDRQALSYWFFGAAGKYALSFEAVPVSFTSAAVARDTFTAPQWDPVSLTMSDLLIADHVEPKDSTIPTAWWNLRLEPSRTFPRVRSDTLWVVWEAYGLGNAGNGTASYQVSIELRSSNGPGLPVQLLERLGLKRPASPTTLQWTSTRQLALDGRALEFVSLKLPDGIEGAYDLRVQVTDPDRHQSVSSVRHLMVSTSSRH